MLTEMYLQTEIRVPIDYNNKNKQKLFLTWSSNFIVKIRKFFQVNTIF